MEYYSQDGQDEFLITLFKGKRNGIFLDIGAFDGIQFSNTYFMEKNLSWTGICIEPNPIVFDELKKNRKCICLNYCVTEEKGSLKFLSVSGWGVMLSGLLEFLDPKHLIRIDETIIKYGGTKEVINVVASPIKDILKAKDITEVDYCNIDVEGGELSVLKSIDFSKVTIKVFTVENNYANTEIKKFLSKEGYKRIWKVGADDVYELHSKRYKLMSKLKIKELKNYISNRLQKKRKY